jgi:hypothetical protein
MDKKGTFMSFEKRKQLNKQMRLAFESRELQIRKISSKKIHPQNPEIGWSLLSGP